VTMTLTDHDALTPERAANLAENPYAGQGSVLLDIGGDVGAVVLHLSAGYEAPRSPTGARARPAAHRHDHPHAHPHLPHVDVVGRPVGDGRAYTAVLPELVAGRYVLTLPDDSELPVEVAGGAVTELRWPRS
jgi:hypothetical protein